MIINILLWCHIRHVNFAEKSPQRITKKDKEMINKLDYEIMKFPISKKDCCKMERQQYLHYCVLLRKWIDLSNLCIKSKV